MRDIRTLIVHCSATRPDMNIGVEEIRQWHLARGWSDIGYHYVIRRNGHLEEGRADAIAGAHVQGHNADSIGICLVGGLGDDLKPDANFTALQYEALISLLRRLRRLYPGASIHGHREFARKACPSFDVQSLLAGLDFDD